MYEIQVQIMNEAESFNTGEPLIRIIRTGSLEFARKRIERILEQRPEAGYVLKKDEEILERKDFDYRLFNKEYYGIG